MNIPSKVTLCEVGLRDGLQNEKTLLATDGKLELARAIIAAGCRAIELGSFVSPKSVPQMADTDALFSALGGTPGVELRALIANPRGVERAAACGCKKVKLNVSASRAHNLANLHMTPEESVSRFQESCVLAKTYGIGISGSISMPFGSPWEKEILVQDVLQIIEAYLDVGVNEISLSDTSGMAVPTQVYSLCELVQRTYPSVRWWLHFHNTRGAAMANILAALQAGITRFDTSFAGLGGCPFVPGAAGNIATEDVVHMLQEMGVETGIALDQTIKLARRLKELVGHETDSYLLRAGCSRDLKLELPVSQSHAAVAK
ncbi:MAG: hydroxymethylglutaryl-CoA lyase [Clostridia bacterium]